MDELVKFCFIECTWRAIKVQRWKVTFEDMIKIVDMLRRIWQNNLYQLSLRGYTRFGVWYW